MTAAIATPVRWAPCHLCGCALPEGQDLAYCEDCEMSDCWYCGTPMPRPLLSDQFACAMCEGDGS